VDVRNDPQYASLFKSMKMNVGFSNWDVLKSKRIEIEEYNEMKKEEESKKKDLSKNIDLDKDKSTIIENEKVVDDKVEETDDENVLDEEGNVVPISKSKSEDTDGDKKHKKE